jgi:short-subunit dehydrogenase
MAATTRPVALITGASAGLGVSFAKQLAARGYDLILVARREERLRPLAESLPVAAEVLGADLAIEEGLATTERAISECERLELLVNNAGFGTLGRFWETDRDGQIRMHELHVMATMRLTQAALKDMVLRKRGAVINVSSVASFGQSPGNVSYCATKAWMTSFTTGLDLELRDIASPVKVQALCPGFTRTEFHETLGMDPGKIPAFFWIPADEVVRISLDALEGGQVIVLPTWRSKVGAALLKYVSPRLVESLRPGGKRV